MTKTIEKLVTMKTEKPDDNGNRKTLITMKTGNP